MRIDKADALKVHVDGLTGAVDDRQTHPSLSAVRRLENGGRGEILQRNKPRRNVQKLNLPTPFSAIETSNARGLVDPCCATIDRLQNHRLQLRILRMCFVAGLDRGARRILFPADDPPSVLIEKIHVDQVVGILAEIRVRPGRAAISGFDQPRAREIRIVCSRSVDDFLVDD
ncbi:MULTISPECIES: hypothetical protein [Bradyrhizobium]|uniref:hypothetical protein n=1 Tax=Bradyrhizobium TaxID=374 RepID=UPI000F73557C|nr:hypothetical protein [Bradyrhizobium elkanii]NWL74871.1 hypothetical protein [Bradyrhizobium elkanii]